MFVQSTMNKEFYFNTIIQTRINLNAIVVMGKDFIFQQDGETPYMTKYNIVSIRKLSK